MGSNLNFKNFGNEPPGDGRGNGSGSGSGSGSGRFPGNNNIPLTRQPSIYSLTFDEFQTTLGGKDFGSMNMDELLKNIWSAEETQSMATAVAAASAAVGSSGHEGGPQGGYLHRQGSLTLPRTLSLKTVDEVLKDITKEFSSGKDGAGGSNVPQRQQTLGEMTLEEFLMKAGVVMEDTQVPGKSNVGGIFGGCSNGNSNNNTGYGINFQQPSRGVESMGNHQIPMQPTNLPINFNGVRNSLQQPTPSQLSQQQQQKQQQQQQQQQQLQQQQQQPLFPKQVAVSYASAVTLPTNGQLGSPGIRGGNVGLADQGHNSKVMSALPGGGMGMFGLGGGGVGIPTGSPAPLRSDGIAKSNGNMPSISPLPYVFNGGSLRGKRCSHAVDKVVERRQRRMIKNRESAARSRARKQAYTVELEQEVANLEAENQELREKQQEIMESQKNQELEMMNAQYGPRKRLRRTQTGPW